MKKEKVYPNYGYEDCLKAFSTEYIQTLLKKAKRGKQKEQDEVNRLCLSQQQYLSSRCNCTYQIGSIKKQISQIGGDAGPVILNLVNCHQMFHNMMHFWMDQAKYAEYADQIGSMIPTSQQDKAFSDVKYDADLDANQIIRNAAVSQGQYCEPVVNYWKSQISRLEDTCISLAPEMDQYLEDLKSLYEEIQDYSVQVAKINQMLGSHKNSMLTHIDNIKKYEKELQSRKETNN